MSRLTLFAIVAAAICSMGVKTGCGGKPVKPENLCTDTGGTWDTSSAKLCWPPACGQTADQATCGTDPVCKCPADKPFWKDGEGCWSQAECNMTCQGTAKTCDDFNHWYGTGDCTDQNGCYRDVCTCYHQCCDTCTRLKYVCDTNNNCHYVSESYSCNCKQCDPYGCYCGPCLGTVDACSAIKDLQECGDQDGCTWK